MHTKQAAMCTPYCLYCLRVLQRPSFKDTLTFPAKPRLPPPLLHWVDPLQRPPAPPLNMCSFTISADPTSSTMCANKCIGALLGDALDLINGLHEVPNDECIATLNKVRGALVCRAACDHVPHTKPPISSLVFCLISTPHPVFSAHTFFPPSPLSLAGAGAGDARAVLAVHG